MEEWRYRPTILDLGTKWRWVVSFTLLPVYPGDRASNTHWIVGWVGPRAGLDAVEKRKNSCPCRESNLGRPAHSRSLYLLSYTSTDSYMCMTWCLIEHRDAFPLNKPITAARGRGRECVFWRSDDGIVGSSLSQSVAICMLFSVFVLSYVGIGLWMGRFLIQGVLLNVCNQESKTRKMGGLGPHWQDKGALNKKVLWV
jgi:hypothetical protein